MNKPQETDYSIALSGNPNVGKSTLFNALTGLRQHTGNWTGKTVGLAFGGFEAKGKRFEVTDLPGAYSLSAFSGEEAVTRDYLQSKNYDCVVIVLDSGILERNLSFALQVLAIAPKAVVCLNLYDESQKRGVIIDEKTLSKELGAPVVKTCATKKQGLKELKNAVYGVCSGKIKCNTEKNLYSISSESYEQISSSLSKRCREICAVCQSLEKDNSFDIKNRRIDRLLTSKAFGIPAMLCLFGLLFWITAIGANYPSELLSLVFGNIKQGLYRAFETLNVDPFFTGLLIDGVYTTLSWVVAVMLPPMAIFFPLFSLVEDSGYLPRIAFNLDKFFSKCGAHGKQSLTMAMGIGCNACGVTGCRILENRRDRLTAILTNNIMPCNGRFPILIAMIMMFFAGSSFGLGSSVMTAALLLMIISGCVLFTLFVSKLLSLTILKSEKPSFALELPPYRKPQLLKTIISSIRDRTLFVLGRAVMVAAPAGAIIWLTANIYIGDFSILKYCTDFFDPLGRLMGLDGVIIMAFVLGFPANETVIPIIIMSYMASGTLVEYTSYEQLLSLFTSNGWTVTTAVCMIIFTVLHFPCSTTCLTIKKETGSHKWTLLSVIIPTALGIILCFLTSSVMRCFGF